jgi:hypothetical protein
MKLLNIEAGHRKKLIASSLSIGNLQKDISIGCLFANLGPVHATKRIIAGYCRTIGTCESKWLS